MKRRTLYSLIAVVAVAGCIFAVRGCYDPTEHSVQAGGGDAKANQTSIDEDDVTLSLDADNTDIKWTGSNAAGMTPYGYFYELAGKAVLNSEGTELKAIEVDIRMDSIKAMNKSLTEKLKHEGFFEVDKFPSSRFESTSITAGPRADDPEGTTHVIEGNFQLRDVTRSIQIPVAINISPSEFKLTSEFSINRKDYGVIYSNSLEDAAIRDGVLLNLDLTVARSVAKAGE